MTLGSRKEYLRIIRERYQDASKAVRTTILDEVCLTCAYSRKHAISLLSPTRQPRKPAHTTPSGRPRGRPRRYDDPRIKTFLTKLWKAGNLPCGKRLRAMIPLWLPFYVLKNGQTLPETIRTLLLEISPATIDRLLAPVRQGGGKLGLATTKPAAILRTQIPIQRSVWREDHPGFFETDTVAHCGTSMSGSFAYTMNLVDISNRKTGAWCGNTSGTTGLIIPRLFR
jgi:hypothetical protein